MTEVPQHVREAARAAFAAHRPGRALLRRVDLNGAVGTGTAPTHPLVFAGDDICVRVDVSRDKGLTHLSVRIEPDVAAVVELQHQDPALSVVTGGGTLLQLDAAPQGLARLLITQDGDASIARRWQTAWTRF